MSKDYPKPSVTVDTIIFALHNDEVKVLLIKRKYPPFAGKWAIPGGFVEVNEALSVAASRELEEETGLKNVTLKQFHTFGDPGRDPRGHTVTITYHTFLAEIPSNLVGADDADEASWFSVNTLPELAFDHDIVLDTAIKDLYTRIETTLQMTDIFVGELKLSQLRNIKHYRK
ncbi:MAG: 7 8-dihydro-8-oxoguanine triphosphatase [bacterium]|nr:MAG: 7 8-dihydro-8-oxoguanine triphosphatase [bacterium]